MIMSNSGRGLEVHYDEYNHKFVINAHTLECLCLASKHEILDLQM